MVGVSLKVGQLELGQRGCCRGAREKRLGQRGCYREAREERLGLG